MTNTYLPYAGIGSRETPSVILAQMTQMAKELCSYGCTLRSGGAPGADQAFEHGVFNDAYKEIFIPWEGFEGRRTTQPGITKIHASCAIEAMDMAGKFHPAWSRCSQGARLLHSRNSGQILGATLSDPSKFVVCWTKGGAGGGGTGQALRMARHFEIPVFDFGNMTLDDIETAIGRILDAH